MTLCCVQWFLAPKYCLLLFLGANECSAKDNNGCEHLCLMTPNGATCVCRDGYDLKGKNCIQNLNYTAPFHCSTGKFMCANNQTCIDRHQVCDNHKDCPDGSDEDASPGGICGDAPVSLSTEGLLSFLTYLPLTSFVIFRKFMSLFLMNRWT